MKTAYASYWTELIYLWLELERKQPQFFDLLLFSLDALNKGAISAEVLSLVFQIRFMSISGFSPDIGNCKYCKTPVDLIEQKNVRFDFKQGQIICSNCDKNKSKYSMIVSKGMLKQLFWINNNDIKRADRMKFSSAAVKEREMLLESFIAFHIRKDFKSLQFLKHLRQEKER